MKNFENIGPHSHLIFTSLIYIMSLRCIALTVILS